MIFVWGRSYKSNYSQNIIVTVPSFGHLPGDESQYDTGSGCHQCHRHCDVYGSSVILRSCLNEVQTSKMKILLKGERCHFRVAGGLRARRTAKTNEREISCIWALLLFLSTGLTQMTRHGANGNSWKSGGQCGDLGKYLKRVRSSIAGSKEVLGSAGHAITYPFWEKNCELLITIRRPRAPCGVRFTIPAFLHSILNDPSYLSIY